MSDADSSVAFTGFVAGRVQGVAFRYSARRAALKLGVCGWVRNLPDDRVEFHAEGGEGPVAEFLAWLEQGPPAARVDAFEPRPAVPAEVDGFAIR